LSSAPEGQSVSNSWFSPQRSGGEVQEFAAQLPHSPRAERGENNILNSFLSITGNFETVNIKFKLC